MSHKAPWMILLAPLVAALLTTLPSRLLGRKVYGIGLLLQVVAFAASVGVLYDVAARGHGPIRLELFSVRGWVPGVLSIDRLAAVMMVVITGLGALIYRFSVRYMQ